MQKQNTINKLIAKIPKAELHLHIEGTLEPQMMFELAKRNNISLAYNSINEIKEAYNFNNLQEFLDIYYSGANVLQTKEDFYDLTFAYLKKSASQNIIHSEFFFDPQTHTERGINFETIFKGIYEATIDAKKEFGISSLIIMSFLRHLSEDDAFKTLEESLPYKDNIIAVGLDSSELGNPPEKFEHVFKKAKELGYRLVAHAGEEGPSEYIWAALNKLNIERIDHGNTSLNDKKLITYIKENRIALTICPLSNLELKVVNSLSLHPLKQMLDHKMLVTVNSDDPAYFGGYLNENFFRISECLGLEPNDIYVLAKNSIEASMLKLTEKEYHIKQIDAFYFKHSSNKL